MAAARENAHAAMLEDRFQGLKRIGGRHLVFLLCYDVSFALVS
jgi:hypothetical protein